MMSNQKGSSRLDAALKMLLIAFISLLAFSSGVFFGKQMSDAKEHEMKALETDAKESAKTAEGGREARPEDALNDEAVAEISERLVKSEKRDVASAPSSTKAVPVAPSAAGKHGDHAAKHDDHAAATDAPAPTAEAHAPKADAHAAKHDDHAPKADAHAPKAEARAAKHDDHAAGADAHAPKAEVSKAATRIAMNESPNAPTVPRAESSSVKALPKSVGGAAEGEFTVQVASYPDVDQAKSRAADLVKKGYPAYPVEALVKGKTWYRVSIGSFRTMKEAGVYRAQLMKDADLRSAIVQRIER